MAKSGIRRKHNLQLYRISFSHFNQYWTCTCKLFCKQTNFLCVDVERGGNIVHTRAVKSVYNDTETLLFRAQKTWDMAPDDIKNVTSLNEFMTKIKQWQHKM